MKRQSPPTIYQPLSNYVCKQSRYNDLMPVWLYEGWRAEFIYSRHDCNLPHTTGPVT